MIKGHKTKELKHNIDAIWKDDEQLLCKEKICKFNVQYLGSVGIDDDKPELLYKQAMTSLLEKKKRFGELRISTFSIVLQDRSTNSLILDQTLKRLSICSTYSLVPFSFFYIAEDVSTNISQLYGFISCKEVSERIVNAIQYAQQLFDEKQHNIKKLEEVKHHNTDVTDTTYKQASLAEKYQDPQSSIVIHNTEIKSRRPMPELKAIPRRRVDKSTERTLVNGLHKLSQDQMFKSSEVISKSPETKMGMSVNEELFEVFNKMPSPNDRDLTESTIEEKLQQIHRINEAYHKANAQGFENVFGDFGNHDNGGSESLKYESLKNVASEAALGWSTKVANTNISIPPSSKSYNAYLDKIVIHDFLNTNPFHSETENNISWKP